MSVSFFPSIQNRVVALAHVSLVFLGLSWIFPGAIHGFPDPGRVNAPEVSSLNSSGPTAGNAMHFNVQIAQQQPGSSVKGESGGSGSAAAVEKITRMNSEVVRLYHGQGDYAAALPLALETCEAARRTLGEEHPEFANSLDNLAAIYKGTGNYAKAEPLLQQALQVWKKISGENSPDYVTTLNNLAGLYSTTGKYAEAETHYLRSLEIIRTNVGEDNAFFVKGLNNLASLHKAIGNFVAVEPLYEKARNILLKIPGDNQRDYAIITSNLAHLYSLVGRYPEAESLYQQSLELTRKTVGEQHPQYARTLNNLASLYETMGNYTKADPLYQQALTILSSTSGKSNPDVAAALSNLGGLHKAIGDYGKAEGYYRQANEIWRGAVGEKHPDYANGLNNLADLRYLMGNFKEAETLYTRVLEIERAALGEKHPDVALAMQNLAVLYKTTRRYPEAEVLFLQALGIWKGALGDLNPNVALTQHNLGALYNGMGKYQDAEPYYRQALEIRSTLLGKDHPDVAATLNNMAALYAATSRESEALDLMIRAQQTNDRLIRNVFSMASESQRMGFVKTLRGEMDSFLSLIVQYLADSPKAVTTGLDLVLKRKAIVAEAMAAERDAVLGGRYPDLEPKVRELRTLRIQIARKILSGPGVEGPDVHRQLLSKWESEKDKLEIDLASRIPEINLERRLADADHQAVAKALPAGVALVEFIRFDPFDFKAIQAKGESPWKPARYLAFVLASGEPQQVLMMDLGQADAIDRMISDFRSAITGEAEKPGGRGITTRSDGKGRSDSSGKLRGAVFDSLAKGLGGCKRLFLAPDGDLYRLPFAALPTEAGRFLIDEYHISYVGSGRDILRFGADAKAKPAAPLVMADPDYDLDGGTQSGQPEKTAQSRRQSRDFVRNAPHFDRLPGTRTEGEHIATLLDVKPLVDRQASKGRLEEYRSPRILHIATHGFFLQDQERSLSRNDQKGDEEGVAAHRRANLLRSVENPLLRSGLVLAGANTWVKGQNPSPEAGDGILTGEEASGLDLLSTEMVVLSACETGLGDIRVGEGVFGLRRAFLLAGAKTLVMSLWKVPDSQTQMLMEGFYKRILEGRPRADALREAQLSIKADFPEPFYWGAFICQGDPGPMPVQGK